MRPKGSAELLSDRRRRALKLLREKLSLNEVARRIRCAASSVMRWRNAWRRRGADALKVRFSPGRPRRLTPRQEQRLVRILLRGAIANGYRTELWTTKRDPDQPLLLAWGESSSCFAGPLPMATARNCGQRSEWRR